MGLGFTDLERIILPNIWHAGHVDGCSGFYYPRHIWDSHNPSWGTSIPTNQPDFTESERDFEHWGHLTCQRLIGQQISLALVLWLPLVVPSWESGGKMLGACGQNHGVERDIVGYNYHQYHGDIMGIVVLIVMYSNERCWDIKFNVCVCVKTYYHQC